MAYATGQLAKFVVSSFDFLFSKILFVLVVSENVQGSNFSAGISVDFGFFQDVVYALAHATGKTGRFTLIERWRSNERLLAPHEHPLKVIHLSLSI